jgi:uncharacterized damage-inducible protein DinB
MELNPYASYLDGRDPVPVLFSTSQQLRRIIAPFSIEQVDQRPAPQKWSIREIVAHLADSEMVFAFRLRQTLATPLNQPHAIIQPFDQDVWVQRYVAYNLVAALDLFQSAREWNLHFLSTVTEPDRRRLTTHPERGTMNFWTIVETMAGHDINHLEQVERIAAGLTPGPGDYNPRASLTSCTRLRK